MGLPEITTRFQLRGSFDPNDITDMIGIPPDRKWREGEARTPLLRWKKSGWSLVFGPERSVDLEAQLKRMLDTVESIQARLRSACDRYDAEAHVFCSADVDDQTPAIILGAETLSRLARLGVELGIDILLTEAD
jgi:Domain of unknown function (DUF4279)